MNPKTSLARRAYFSCARTLQNPDWSDEQNRAVFGKNVSPHGHDYILDVFYGGDIGACDGMIVNLSDIKPILVQVLETLDGKFLDREVAFFQSRRPTTENIVNFVWQQLPKDLDAARLVRVLVRESARLAIEKSAAGKDESESTMKLTRCYEFAAAHRLHVPRMSAQDNTNLYGKCNNPHGHGHNYGLEVTVEGVPDADTGALISLVELDKIVDEEVYDRFDHKHLNEDCPEFENLVPTSENLARVIFDVLQARLNSNGRSLAKIGLHETQKNYFEVEA